MPCCPASPVPRSRQLGVSHNLIPQRFGSKDRLWYAAVDQGFGTLLSDLLPVVVEANRLVRAFLAAQPNTSYIDIYPVMLDAAGQPQEALFVGDRLHMKPAGYVIWQRVIAPYLTKD